MIIIIIITSQYGSASISLNIVYSIFYIDPTVGVMHNAVHSKSSLGLAVEK